MNPPDYFPAAARLALELECLLLDTKDLPTQSRWWDSAHEALEQWRRVVAMVEADHVRADVGRARDCDHCGGMGDILGEYPGFACQSCNGSGKVAPEVKP